MTSSSLPSVPSVPSAPSSPLVPLVPSASHRTRIVAALGAFAVSAYAVFAAVQIQVLNPLATVPGSTLGEIHAAVSRTTDTMGWGLMIALLLPGPMIAGAAALAGMRGRHSTATLALVMLGLLAGGSPVYLAASFPAGMTLADTFGVGGADHAPWAIILHAISLLALVTFVIIWLVRAVRRPSVSAPRTA